MSPIYPFLFFLSQQSKYFPIQDSILEILSRYPHNHYDDILNALTELDSEIIFKTLELMNSEKPPFYETRLKRLRYGEPNYPAEFMQILDPPLVLSFLGEPVWMRDKIAVVGSRQPSQKTLWWLRKELGSILSQNDLVSVSGGAIGVDQLAHQASIDLKMPTIAVLPSGLGNLYPKCFQTMSQDILKNGGCLISEFSDDLAVRKHHFSYRNRLIAALGKVSIVVEAREKSGTLITAHRALEMGRDVFVVPGHPLDESFRGSLQLLKLGAHLLTESNDLSFWL